MLVVEDPVELAVLLDEEFVDDELVDEEDDVPVELEAGCLGKAVLLPRPKPIAEASVPLPPMSGRGFYR